MTISSCYPSIVWNDQTYLSRYIFSSAHFLQHTGSLLEAYWKPTGSLLAAYWQHTGVSFAHVERVCAVFASDHIEFMRMECSVV